MSCLTASAKIELRLPGQIHRSAKLAAIRGLLNIPAPVIGTARNDYRTCYAALTRRSFDIYACCGKPTGEIAAFGRWRRPSSPRYNSS